MGLWENLSNTEYGNRTVIHSLLSGRWKQEDMAHYSGSKAEPKGSDKAC